MNRNLRRLFVGLTTATIVAVSLTASADFPPTVTNIDSAKGKTVSVTGKLESGAPMASLSWAWNSSVACFPQPQASFFAGNHVLYSTTIPPHSIMHVTVTPKDPKKDLSVYAYMIGTTNYHVPPALPSCVTCEAEHKWDRPKKGQTQDHTRTVRLNATTHPYNVVIGVTGPAGTTSGDYTLDVKIE